MKLAELIRLRPMPGAGLLVSMTQRCPLRCAHCSTSSTMDGPQPQAADLLRFFGSFTAANRPEVVLLTGGEPLLRPDLVARLAASARGAGVRSAVLTGAFFAQGGRIPDRILRLVDAVDHFSVSIDAYHEREVARDNVFRLLTAVLARGVEVSLHAVGTEPDDPYLAGLIAQVRAAFGDRVPVLVNTVRAVGRAAAWATARPIADDRVLPCAMAAWPVIAADGVVVACCNQQTVERRPVPDHLRLGHIATEDWAAVRDRILSSPELRALRVVGPTFLLAGQEGGDGAEFPWRGDTYCGSCRRLGEHPKALATAQKLGSGVVGELLDQHATRVQVEAGPVTFMRRHGSPGHAAQVAPSPGAPGRRKAVR